MSQGAGHFVSERVRQGVVGARVAQGPGEVTGAAAVVRAAINCPLSPVERIRYERQVVLARLKLTEGAWMAAWAEGQALSLAQAMTAALDHELTNLQLEA